jgi:hypothetical protein
VLDEVLQIAEMGEPVPGEHDHMLAAGRLCFFVHFPRVGGIQRQWLLAQDMQSSIQGRHRDWVMPRVRRDDDQCIERATRDHGAVVREDVRDGILCGQLLSPRARPPADGRNLCAWMTRQVRQVESVGKPAGANHADTDMLSHA